MTAFAAQPPLAGDLIALACRVMPADSSCQRSGPPMGPVFLYPQETFPRTTTAWRRMGVTHEHAD